MSATVDPRAVQRVLDGRWAPVRDEVRAQLGGERLLPDPDLTTEQHRDRVAHGLRLIAGSGRPRAGFDVARGGSEDLGGVVTGFQMLGFGDLSLLVKAGVQWGLFGGAVQALGTQSHHAACLPQIISGELLGCFAMTETGHGSDVAALRTTATYDDETDELVVNTPDDDGRQD